MSCVTLIIMVVRCFVCKKTYIEGSRRSFHRFPRNPNKILIWFNKLGLPQNTIVTKFARVCSEHFSPDDFELKPSGIRYLSSSAVPSMASSSAVDIKWSERNVPVILGVEDLDSDKENTALDASSQLRYKCQNSSPGVDSESTVPASSPQTLETVSTAESEVEPPKKKKTRRYFGDCHSSDMSSPTRSKQNWKIAKRTIIQYKKKIKLLQQSQRRLRSRIVCLKSLLHYLTENRFITESVETVIHVRN